MRKISSLVITFGLVWGITTLAFAEGSTMRSERPTQPLVVQQTYVTIVVPQRGPYEGHADFTHDYAYACHNGLWGLPFLGLYGGFPFTRGVGFGVGIGF